MKKLLLVVLVITNIIVPVFSSAEDEILALDCKNLKGLALRDEKFKKDGFSTARLIIIFYRNVNKLVYNWSQETVASNNSMEELKVVQSNSNMVLGYSVKNGLEGLRVHLKKKTAVYFKHVAPVVDGFGTDSIYKMKCVDVSEKLKNKTNKK